MHFMNFRRKAILASIALPISACHQLDTIAGKWNDIVVGTSKSSAITSLGNPTSIYSIELPILRLDHMAWKSLSNGRIYIAICFLDRVVSKATIS
jgi:hypothetical protein